MFDLALGAAVVLVSLGVGRMILHRFRWQGTWLEEAVFAFGLGAGGLSLTLLGLGLTSLLYAPLVLSILIGGLVITHREWRTVIREARHRWAQRSPWAWTERLLLLALGAVILPVTLAALMPPTDADALLYHLYAPALFLKHHALIPMFNNVGVNYPLGVDLLYLFGLAAGYDSVAQLIHLAFALALTVGIYAFAVPRFSRLVGLLAALGFWTSAVVGLLASAPLLDLGWAFYEFLAVYAFLRWRTARQTSDLVLSGVMAGLALTNKYLAVVGWGLLGILVLGESMRDSPRRLSTIVKNLVLFGSVAAAICSPWYLKNWLWLGNPVYPFFFGYYGLDGHLRQPVRDWVGMGLGRDLLALLLFPWNVYVHWQFFSSGFNRGGPSLLFLFLPFYLFVPKHTLVNWLLLLCAVRFALWWPYAQNIRYLVMILPWLSLASAYTISMLPRRLPRPSLRFAIGVIVALFCLVGIGLQWGFLLLLREGVFPFLLGQLSREAYLDANLLAYRAIRFMNDHLPMDARLLAIGEQRVYYLQRAVIPDDSHENWFDLLAMQGTLPRVAQYLQSLGITHVWISQDDLTYTRNFWDGDQAFRTELQALAEFRESYLELVYADDRGHTVYALRPQAPSE